MKPNRAISGDSGRFGAISGRSRMATKSKLEQAVEEKAAGLNDARKEIVMSQLSAYRKNLARLSDVEAELKAVGAMRTATLDEVRRKQAMRSALAYEHNQLSTSNSKIASDLFGFLEE